MRRPHSEAEQEGAGPSCEEGCPRRAHGSLGVRARATVSMHCCCIASLLLALQPFDLDVLPHSLRTHNLLHAHPVHAPCASDCRNNYVFHRETGRRTWATAGSAAAAPADGGATSVGCDAISCWFSRLPIVPCSVSSPWGAQTHLDFKLTMVLIHGLHGHPDYTIRVGSPAWVHSTGEICACLNVGCFAASISLRLLCMLSCSVLVYSSCVLDPMNPTSPFYSLCPSFTCGLTLQATCKRRF